MAARLWPYPWPLTLLWAVPMLAMAALMFIAATEGLSLGSPALYAAFTLLALAVADAPQWSRGPVALSAGRWAFFMAEVCLLYFGGWFLGWLTDNRPSSQLVFEYPWVSAGINEMIGAGFALIAVLHLVFLWVTRHQQKEG